jgi:chromosome partitioning protein
VLLATELAQRGASVTIIDADPNQPVLRWSKKPGKPETLTVIAGVTEETLMDTIDKAAHKTAFVIVDLLHDKRQDGEAERFTTGRVAWVETVNLPTGDPERAWRIMAHTALAGRRC